MWKSPVIALGVLATAAAPAMAENVVSGGRAEGTRMGSLSTGAELPAYLECVPYARQVSGIPIYGDALTWWDQAEGRFGRGHVPRAGAVMALKPNANMLLGHVATVSRVIDSRTVLLNHANWSPVNGQRGQVEDGVRAVDVSPRNDWSEVRIWYAPQNDLGTTRWPVHGFIYLDKANTASSTRMAQAPRPVAPATASHAASPDPIGAIIGTL